MTHRDNNEQQKLILLAGNASKKSKQVSRRTGNVCVSYNRVSSKEQMINGNSLDWQNEQIYQYATKNNLSIKATFGGTFESAKTDERNEFQRMLKEIKSDKSISSVLVYCYDRFSRSGTNGIFLMENLRSLGIRIISISQEIDTETPTGVFQENLFMLLSKLDNDMRKDKSMSGTKSMLRKGYWPYAPPIGYSNRNKHTNADKHDLYINEAGEHLKQAFKWKASGKYSNREILDKLRIRGVKITLRNLAWVFVNPFYCGYIKSSMLPGELIIGKHPALTDKDIFLKANNISNQNPRAGVPRAHKVDELALKVFTVDEQSGTPYTGYQNKVKHLFYYKTRNNACAVNISAKKLNNKFIAELTKYEYKTEHKNELKDAIRDQVEKLGEEK